MNAAEKLELAIKLLTEIRQEMDQSRAVNTQKSPANVADDPTMFITSSALNAASTSQPDKD